MGKVAVIARREFWIGLTRWSFWLLTLGLPLLIGAIGLISVVVALYTGHSMAIGQGKVMPRALGVLDHAQILDWKAQNQAEPAPSLSPELMALLDRISLPTRIRDRVETTLRRTRWDRPMSYVVFDDLETGRDAVAAGGVRGLLEIAPDFAESFATTLHLAELGRKRFSLTMAEADLRDALLSRSLSRERIEQVMHPLARLRTVHLADAAAPVEDPFDGARMALPLTFMFIMMLAILTSVDRLVRGLVEEKTNRVIEVLVSSATAEQLMAGKVLGLGALGLTQLLIWLGLGLGPAAGLLTMVEINPIDLVVFFVYFLLGYFLMATLVLALGSLGSNLQEASQFSGVVIMLTVLPTIAFPAIAEAPAGVIARVLTYFPFTAPIVVVFRHSLNALPTWEILLSIGLLLAAIALAVRVGARVFRVGLLLTGKPPSLAAIWRAVRAESHR